MPISPKDLVMKRALTTAVLAFAAVAAFAPAANATDLLPADPVQSVERTVAFPQTRKCYSERSVCVRERNDFARYNDYAVGPLQEEPGPAPDATCAGGGCPRGYFYYTVTRR